MKTFTERLLAWGRENGRHDLPWKSLGPYATHVSEVMLIQTQVATVRRYFATFMARFPSVDALAAAAPDEVMACWAGLGYYARARALHAAARQVVEEFGGEYPREVERLVQLKGVGRSTAAAIASQAFAQRAAILDANVRRVLARHAGVDGFNSAFEKRLWALAEERLPAAGAVSPVYAEWTQTIMDHGALCCTARRPACDRCPVRQDCVARLTGRVAALPAARPKKSPPQREAVMLICLHAGEVLLQRRPDEGVWGGLWVLPETVPGVTVPDRFLDPLVHTFSHFKLHIRPQLHCLGAPLAAPRDHRWWPLSAVHRGEVGMPAPLRRVLAGLIEDPPVEGPGDNPPAAG